MSAHQQIQATPARVSTSASSAPPEMARNQEASAAGVRIRPFDRAQTGRWNAYVEATPGATFFHLAEWGALVESVFGHEICSVFAERQGRICGVLPLVRQRSRLFGHTLCSTPFAVYGGAVADDAGVAALLEDHAAGLARELDVDQLELRNLHRDRPDWPGKALYVTFRKAIHPEVEKNLLAIPRKQRAMVRKGEAAGLRAERDQDLDRFWTIYSTSVRDHGTPVFSRRWFEGLKRTFGERCEVSTVVRDGEAVSSVMSFYFRDEVLPYYGGGLAAARECKAFDFMYWDLMRRACERGCRVFDYGRSKVGTGSWSFKKNWGFEPTPLPYRYHLVRARGVPDVNPLNPKYQAFIALWQRLPLPLANLLGPLVARGLG